VLDLQREVSTDTAQLCAIPLSVAELDAHSHFSRLITQLASQTNATFPFITTTIRFPFPSDDHSAGVPPPTVIHAVTGPQMSVSEWRDIVREGAANSTSRSRAGYASSWSVLSEKLSYLSLRPSVRQSAQMSQLEGRWTFSLTFFPQTYRYILVFIKIGQHTRTFCTNYSKRLYAHSQ
jgi:hypothetical protein